MYFVWLNEKVERKLVKKSSGHVTSRDGSYLVVAALQVQQEIESDADNINAFVVGQC